MSMVSMYCQDLHFPRSRFRFAEVVVVVLKIETPHMIMEEIIDIAFIAPLNKHMDIDLGPFYDDDDGSTSKGYSLNW